MKIYYVYSSYFEDLLLQENCRMLINYPAAGAYNKRYPDIPSGFREVLIDSGGYQLQTGVASVYLKAYSLWLQLMLPNHPEVVGYFNLDFSDPLDSLNNQRFLESEGLKPIPVWHAGDPQVFLDLYTKDYEWISIGGLASSKVTGKKGLAKMVNWIISTYPSTKFHILGMGISGVDAFRQTKPYSVDFSTWGTASRFGHAIVRDSKNWIKEVALPDEERNRLRTDKEFRRKATLDSIRNFAYFEEQVNGYEVNSRQGVLL